LVDEPTVTNVYSGHHPTYEMTPEIPHDGYLADFLMRNKGLHPRLNIYGDDMCNSSCDSDLDQPPDADGDML